MTDTKIAAIVAVKAIADAIKEVKSIPSGHLYAHVMSYMSLDAYNQIIAILKQAGVVSESNHMLTWVGEKAKV